MNVIHLRRILASRPFVIMSLIALVVALTTLLLSRYWPAISAPNFYAEDGTEFARTILDRGVLGAALTPFNGYLVVGQYLVAGAAFVPYYLGAPFSSLPLLIAVASCAFLGLTAALPVILFRKELGLVVAVMTSVLLVFVPLPGSDFAVIGTIGNLKFAFLFWAVVFIVYRNLHSHDVRKVMLSDAVLLLCVLTNGPVVLLLPFILLPYRHELWRMVTRRKFDLRFFKRPEVLSVVALCAIAAAYVVAVYVKGIPEIPNYLQEAYDWEATENIIYRVTLYAWLFAVSAGMTDRTAVAVTVITVAAVLTLARRGRAVFLFGLYAIAVATLSFVVTRTGIGEHMLFYEKTPDQFFYAQTLVFVFICMWVLAPAVRSWRAQGVLIAAGAVFIISTAGYGSSYGQNSAIYQQRGDIYSNLDKACANPGAQKVQIPIYPTGNWSMSVDRERACR